MDSSPPHLPSKAPHTPTPNAAHGVHQLQGTSTMRHQAAPPATRQLTSPLVVAVLYEIGHDDRVASEFSKQMAPPRCIHIHTLPLTTNHTPAPVIVMRTRQATAGRVVSHKSDYSDTIDSRDTQTLQTHKQTPHLQQTAEAASKCTVGGTSHGEAIVDVVSQLAP